MPFVTPKPIAPLLAAHALDGVAQCRARHSGGVSRQETTQHLCVALADLAQHPTYGFVYKVVLVRQQRECDAQGVVKLAGADERECRHYGYALFPQVIAVRQGVKRCPVGRVAVEQPVADDVGRAVVDQIPIVDLRCVREVEAGDGVARGSVTDGAAAREVVAHSPDEQQQCAEAYLVPRALEQRCYFGQRDVARDGFEHRPQGGGFEADKLVILGVLTFAAFEVSLHGDATFVGAEG